MSHRASHLGDRLSALVDGELGHDERDRILVHLTRCPDCRAAVDEARRLKARLAAMAAGPEPSPALTGRLLALAQAAPGAAPPPGPGAREDARRPRTDRAPRGPRRRVARRARPGRRRVALASSGAAVALALGTAFAVGGGSDNSPAVRPSVDRFTVEHAAVTGEVPLTDPGSAVSVSFTRPAP